MRMSWSDILALGAIIWIAMLLVRLADAEAEVEVLRAYIWIAMLLVRLADAEAEVEVLRAYRDIRDRRDDEESE